MPDRLTTGGTDVSGPVLFARYAFPPNHHGYCGPGDSGTFFARGVAGDDRELRTMVADFDGAAPFLQAIAESSGYADPLDPAVVEAYWLGGPALGRVDADAARTQVGAGSGPFFTSLHEALQAGAVPHHSFVVFCVYPWVAMLGDPRRTARAMTVLDGCRIRWGRVLSVTRDQLTAEVQPLVWDGGGLGYGPAEVETVTHAIDGRGLASPLAVGDRVALHWDWVCDRISDQQQHELQTYSDRHLVLANRMLALRGRDVA